VKKATSTSLLLAIATMMTTPAAATVSGYSMTVDAKWGGSNEPYKSGTYAYTRTKVGGWDGFNDTNWLQDTFMDGASSSAEARHMANIQPGVLKAKVVTNLSAYNPFQVSQESTWASVSLDLADRDIITFGGFNASALAQITNFVEAKFFREVFSNASGDNGSMSTQNSFAYSSTIRVYDSMAALLSGREAPKSNSNWTICSNPRLCTGRSNFNSGKRLERRQFLVDADDVMIIDTSVSMFSDLYATRTRLGNDRNDFFGLRYAIQNYDFANSGYTLINMLTPGAEYASAAGQYPASLPPSAVPEPASWSMLITGFGMIGAAMRRRNQIAQPRVVAA
jgi:hypothetical protein